MSSGEHGFNGNVDVAGRAVLETHSTREPADELTMNLALRSPSANRSPADEPGQILRRNHVEELGAGGDAHFGEIEEEMAGDTQTFVDVVRFVEVGIVD